MWNDIWIQDCSPAEEVPQLSLSPAKRSVLLRQIRGEDRKEGERIMKKSVSKIIVTLLLAGVLALSASIEPAQRIGSGYVSAVDGKPAGWISLATALPLQTLPPEIIILSPQATTYDVTPVALTFTVNESTCWIGYCLDGQSNVTISGNSTLAGLSFGQHSIIVYANDTAGNMGSSGVVNFTIVQPRTIIVPDDYSSIQGAINAASDGDIIFVRSGTYYENLVVNKVLSLVGEDKQTTNIDGNNTGYSVRIQSNGVILRNFTIENGDLVDVRVNQNVSQVVIENNSIINSSWGIYLGGSLNGTIEENLVENCGDAGIFVESSSYNLIVGNTVVNNHEGIVLTSAPHIPEVPPVLSTFSTLYHNNLLNNSVQAISRGAGNVWDNGYPSGGNYWSDYSGTDIFNGPYQNETGSDGIADAPYGLDVYPLLKPYPWALHDVGITSVTVSADTVVQGQNVTVNLMIFNYGDCTETLNITLYANDASIGEIDNVELTSRNFTVIAFAWNTSSFVFGGYIISTYAEPVLGEIDVADNTRVGDTVQIIPVGGGCGGPMPYMD
jgi:parallel beta-helix repeat protein